MQIEKVTGERARDSYYKIQHPSGLSIYLYPKESCSTAYAVFGAKYGSIDTCFQRSDETKPETVPEGIAHYLEHKLFESEDGDAFERFAKTGASAASASADILMIFSENSICYPFSSYAA